MNNQKLEIFSKWYENSSVRISPRRVLHDEPLNHFFSPAVAPILSHTLIQSLQNSSILEIEIQLLYKYLKFTEYLETRMVNKVIVSISNDTDGLDFPEELRKQAYKIYCDEAYHALQASDMCEQVRSVTGVTAIPMMIELERELDYLKSGYPVAIRNYFDLLFVAVSENLVSNELNGCMKDHSIHTEIINLIRDHARDEVAHAIFFRHVLVHISKKLGRESFRLFVESLNSLLWAYLIPDRHNLELILQKHLGDEQCQRLLDEWLSNENCQKIVDRCSTDFRKVVLEIFESADYTIPI